MNWKKNSEVVRLWKLAVGCSSSINNMSVRVFIALSIFFCFSAHLNAQADRAKRPASFPVPPKSEKSLFFLQRNRNENTIVYDANLNEKGEYDPAQPIDVYWLRYTSTGYRREISWLEKTFAYGYSSKKKEGKYEVELVAYDGRKVYLEKNNRGKPIACIEIKGKKCQLDFIYVFADESGKWPKVIHVDIHGTDLASGEKIKERILND